jgi:beta-galactosidase
MRKDDKKNVGRREFMTALVGALSIAKQGTASSAYANGQSAKAHTFGWKGEHFLLNGKPFQIISGEMHYARVPREYWRDRLRKIRAMGLNTVCTYMFWNVHEPQPGKFNFEGNLDVAAFIRTAQEEGLWVLLRPGPYSCAEWDFGGFPAWLLATPDMHVRTTDPRFLKAANNYLRQVGEQLAPLQITRGGPILMAQVENEYGSFGKDKVYLNAIRQAICDAGFEVTLYTSDGSAADMLAGGTLPETLSAINFGDGDDPAQEFANFAKFRHNVPRMCGEFWVGWFDHWGEKHRLTSPESGAKGLEWMLSRGISVNLYMVHGGTSFGFMSGANYDRAYQPDISSYDYDSPLDEAGRPTKKFSTLSEVIRKYLPAGTQLPPMPEPLPMVEIPRFELKESASPWALLGQPVRSEKPQPMEALGQSYGFIFYRTMIEQSARGRLEIKEPRDYAVVYHGHRRLGVLDRRLKQVDLEVELSAGEPLGIVVENMGRINYGPHLVDDRKGITERVAVDGKELTNWEIYPVPLDDLSSLTFSSASTTGTGFYRGTFDLESVGDTFLDMRGWGKGYVWVNGNNLGRYWHIGPQQSLYVPAAWLKKGKNEVIALDLEEAQQRSLEGRKEAVWGNEG